MYKVPQKQAPLKTKPYKNKAYLSWLHGQGLTCMVCGVPQIEIHHLESGSKGRPDNKCVPLCPNCHRGKESPHGANAKEFKGKYQEQMEDYAAELFLRFKEEEHD